MNAPAPLRRVRTLAHVLLDIADARRAEQAAWERTRDMNDDDADRIYGAAADELNALCDEARQMIEDATGVSWDEMLRSGL